MLNKHEKPVIISINIKVNNNVGTKDLKIVLLKCDLIHFNSSSQLINLSKPDWKNKIKKKKYKQIKENSNKEREKINCSINKKYLSI